MHFHIGHNVPGYMPESEVHCTDSALEALAVWRSDIRFHIERLDDDGAFLDADTAQNVVTVADVENGVWQDVESERYWIESQADDIALCREDME